MSSKSGNRITKKHIDARNLSCPLPLLKTKLALSELIPGDIVEVISTDPTSWKDFYSYAKISGNKLLKAEKKKKKYIYILQKK